MKNVLIATILCLFYFLSGQVNGSHTIELSVADWPPYYSKTLPGYGSHASKLTQAFNAAGVPMSFVWYDDWEKAINTAKRGRHYGTPGWSCNRERSKSFLFSEPIGVNMILFYHRKDFPFDWNEVSDLSKAGTIGKPKSYSYGEAFDQAEKDGELKLFYVRHELFAMKMLAQKRIDIAPIDKHYAEFLLQDTLKEASQNITAHKKPIDITLPRILINKQAAERNKNLLAKVNEVLASKNHEILKQVEQFGIDQTCNFSEQ